MFSYNTFGHLGGEFTRVYGLIRTEFARLWEEYRSGNRSAPELERAIAVAATPPGFWFDMFIALNHHFGVMDAGELVEFWPLFARCFQPSLVDGRRLSADTDRIVLAAELNRCRLSAARTPALEVQRLVLNPVSYGPFTEEQLTHIERHHPRLLEAACGSGYLLRVLRGRPRPVDAVGFDLGVYRPAVLAGGDVAITEAHAWTAELEAAGAMHTGGVELIPGLCAGRTLLVSYPEPGGELAFQALRSFREAGGRRFLFKLGGLIGRHTDVTGSYRPPENPGRNIRNFFEELAKYWGPGRATPAWIPELYENNLLEFELLPAPRLFSWEEGASAPEPQRKTPKERAQERKKKRKK